MSTSFYFGSGSASNLMGSNLEGFLGSVVCVSSDEVLKQQLRVSKVAGIILE